MTASLRSETPQSSIVSFWRTRCVVSFQRVVNWVCLLVLMAVAIGVTHWVWQTSSALTFQDDAAQTLSTAAHLYQGHGVATSVLYYDSQLDQSVPARQTVWPPGLPYSAAALARLTGGSLESSVVAVLLAAHLIIALALAAIVWLALGRGQITPVLPTAVAVGWAIYTPALLNVTRGLAEPLFQVFAILAVLALIKAARPCETPAWQPANGSPTPYRFWLLSAGIAVAGAVLSRYQAIALIGPLAVAASLVPPPGTRLARRLFASLLAVALPGAVAVGLLTRNWLITGSLTGGAHSDQGQTLAEVASRIAWLPQAWQMTGLALLLASALAAFVLGTTLWVRQFDVCRSRPAVFGRRLRVALVFCLLAYGANIGLLAGLSLVSTVYVIELRYLTVNSLFMVVPAVAMGLCSLGLIARLNRGHHAPLVLTSVIAAVAMLQFLAFQSPMLARIAGAQPGMIKEILSTHQIQGESVLGWLQRDPNQGSALLTSHAHGLSLVLNRALPATRTVIGVPLPVYTNKVWSGGEIQAAAQRHSVHYVLAFRQMPTWVFDDPVNQLVSKPETAPRWLEPLLVTDELFLARVSLPMISSRCVAQASVKVSTHANRACHD